MGFIAGFAQGLDPNHDLVDTIVKRYIGKRIKDTAADVSPTETADQPGPPSVVATNTGSYADQYGPMPTPQGPIIGNSAFGNASAFNYASAAQGAATGYPTFDYAPAQQDPSTAGGPITHYTVNGTQYDDSDAAQAAADSYNSPLSKSQRIATIMYQHDPAAAAQLQLHGLQAQNAQLDYNIHSTDFKNQQAMKKAFNDASSIADPTARAKAETDAVARFGTPEQASSFRHSQLDYNVTNTNYTNQVALKKAFNDTAGIADPVERAKAQMEAITKLGTADQVLGFENISQGIMLKQIETQAAKHQLALQRAQDSGNPAILDRDFNATDIGLSHNTVQHPDGSWTTYQGATGTDPSSWKPFISGRDSADYFTNLYKQNPKAAQDLATAQAKAHYDDSMSDYYAGSNPTKLLESMIKAGGGMGGAGGFGGMGGNRLTFKQQAEAQQQTAQATNMWHQLAAGAYGSKPPAGVGVDNLTGKYVPNPQQAAALTSIIRNSVASGAYANPATVIPQLATSKPVTNPQTGGIGYMLRDGDTTIFAPTGEQDPAWKAPAGSGISRGGDVPSTRSGSNGFPVVTPQVQRGRDANVRVPILQEEYMKEVQALKQAPNPEEAALHQKNIAMLTQQLAQLHAVPDPQGGPLVRDPGPASTATGTPERQTSATSPARSYFNGRPKAGDATVNIGGTVYRHTPGTALAGVAFNRALSDATKRAGIPDMPPARTSGAGAHSTPRPNPAYASWYAKYGRAYNDIHRKLSTVYDK